jgi:hypothetical protein
MRRIKQRHRRMTCKCTAEVRVMRGHVMRKSAGVASRAESGRDYVHDEDTTSVPGVPADKNNLVLFSAETIGRVHP